MSRVGECSDHAPPVVPPITKPSTPFEIWVSTCASNVSCGARQPSAQVVAGGQGGRLRDDPRVVIIYSLERSVRSERCGPPPTAVRAATTTTSATSLLCSAFPSLARARTMSILPQGWYGVLIAVMSRAAWRRCVAADLAELSIEKFRRLIEAESAEPAARRGRMVRREEAIGLGWERRRRWHRCYRQAKVRSSKHFLLARRPIFYCPSRFEFSAAA